MTPGGSEVTGTSQAVCVLAAPRSGTSLTARMINLLGVSFGPQSHLIEPGKHNEKGFWEHTQIRDVNSTILERLGGQWHDPPTRWPSAWPSGSTLDDLREKARAILIEDFGNETLWGWKDLMTCLTLPFWQLLVPNLRYVICLRNPFDVARSEQRRNPFTFEKCCYLWLTYTIDALRHTEGRDRIFLWTDDLIQDWPEQLPRLASFLSRSEAAGQPAVRDAVRGFIDVNLWHHRSTSSPSDSPSIDHDSNEVAATMQRVYETLRNQGSLHEAATLPMLQEALAVVAPIARTSQAARDQHDRLQRRKRIEAAARDLVALINAGERFILVDNEELRTEMVPNHPVFPFLEQDGNYWGSPADDDTAIRELDRLRRAEAAFIVFAWPAFWWLDHYAGFHQHLRTHYHCVLENDSLVIFNLQTMTAD